MDGRGNVYVSDANLNATLEWTAASNTVTQVSGSAYAPAVDANGNIFLADGQGNRVYEVPRAFIDPTPRIEGVGGAQDTLSPVLPANEDLLFALAPMPGQSWVNITSTAGDAIQFTVSPSASARSTTINLYGEAIPIIQTNNVFAPQIGGVKLLGNGTVEFLFTNNPNASFTVLGTSNLSLPTSNWTVLGVTTNVSADVYEFIDTDATNVTRFYRVQSP